MPGLTKICFPDSIVFQNLSIGGELYQWDFGDGTALIRLDKKNIKHGYASSGRYNVTLTAIDQNTCIGRDVARTTIDVFDTDTEIQDDDDLCLGTPYTLFASGGEFYVWESKDGLFQSTEPTPLVTPEDTTLYYITITASNGCVHQDSVQLNVISVVTPEFELTRFSACVGRPEVFVKSTTNGMLPGDKLFFDFGDGFVSEDIQQAHVFNQDGLYSIKLVGVREFCVMEKIIPTPIFTLFVPNVITPLGSEGDNDVFTIQYGDDPNITPADFGFKVALIVYNRWGNKVFETDDYNYNWSGDGLASGVYYYELTVQKHDPCKGWIHVLK